jgi:hypothetical protein
MTLLTDAMISPVDSIQFNSIQFNSIRSDAVRWQRAWPETQAA